MADILLPEVDFIISTDTSEYGGILDKNDIKNIILIT